VWQAAPRSAADADHAQIVRAAGLAEPDAGVPDDEVAEPGDVLGRAVASAIFRALRALS